MDARGTLAALLAYGRAERRLGEGIGNYTEVDAALDALLVKLWPVATRELSRMCSWCREYASPEDEALARAGAPVTHGLCDRCLKFVQSQGVAV